MLINKFIIEKLREHVSVSFHNQSTNDLIKDIKKNKKNFFFKRSNKKFCIIFLKSADWESKIIKKKCIKIRLICSNDEKLLKDTFKEAGKILKKYFWIQYDSHNQNSFINNFLSKQKFFINNTYYQWEITPFKINQKYLIKKNLFDLRKAKRNDLMLLYNFFKKNPYPGRYYLEKKIRKYSGLLYGDWIKNIFNKKKKWNFVILKREKKTILGAQGFSEKKGFANLDILRVDQKFINTGLGYSLLSFGIKEFLKNKNLKYIRTRTSKFNHKINIIKKKLGFKIIGTGINFSKIN